MQSARYVTASTPWFTWAPTRAWMLRGRACCPNNVIAAYNVFESARQAGCRRVVYASSINAVLGYPLDQQVQTSQPVYPVNLYGATKCWGGGAGPLLLGPRTVSPACACVSGPSSTAIRNGFTWTTTISISSRRWTTMPA